MCFRWLYRITPSAGDQLPLPQEHGLGDQAFSPLSGIREESPVGPVAGWKIIPLFFLCVSELGLVHPFIKEISHETGTQ